MTMKIIKVWVDKNDRSDWLRCSSKIDCRNKKGYSLVGFIGYNIQTIGEYTYFDSDSGLGRINKNTVLSINVDSIIDKT